MVLLLNDEDVLRQLTPTEAIAVMEGVFRARAAEQVYSQPRWEQPFSEGSLVFTVGAVPEGVGFRAYLNGHFAYNDQLTAVWDRRDGALIGVVVGAQLGNLRTGAIGGVALKYLAPPQTTVLGLVGTGRQAFYQLRTAALVCPHLREVRVYSRTPAHVEGFCADLRTLLGGVSMVPVPSAEAAVRGAQTVISATNSTTPVIYGEWLAPGAHVTTVGPKGHTLRETDPAVIQRAELIVTDSPEQVRAYSYGSLMDGVPKALHDLAQVVIGKIQRPPQGISLFISTGLAGTEVALAARLLEKARKKRWET
jgi:ornithine cyclodeaminase